MRILFIVIVLIVSSVCFGQGYLRTNEQIIFSFGTNNQKQMYLVKDKSDKYIVYRFGTKEKIEFEYPAVKDGSWGDFTYSYYLRGGGPANEGMDLNYVYFTNNGFRYVIYQTYYAVENKIKIGVRIIDDRTSKIIDIKGNVKTRKGSLIGFRDNGLLNIGEEIFD